VPLTPPKLDERTFKELFEGARARIPNYLPDWTDWNESDPGITLLQLQAWLTETLLFQLNRLPELNYIKFLQLLGIEQLPALAAKADVTFVLDENKLKGLPEIEIPVGTLLRVASRDLPEPVYFQTDQTLTAINARLDLLVSQDPEADPPVTDVTLANKLDNAVFLPFGSDRQAREVESEKAYLLLGFASNVPLSRQEFGLQIYLKDEPLAPLAPPVKDDCGPEANDMAAPTVRWEWFDGLLWQGLVVTSDETQHLRRSGKVFVKIPGQIPAVPAHALELVPVPLPASLGNVKHVAPAILVVLNTSTPAIQSISQLAAKKEADLFTLLEASLRGSDEEKQKIVKEMVEDAKRLLKDSSPPLYYMLRVVFDSGEFLQAPEIDRILINTVSVTAARTANDEVVGSSDGLPNQVMKLRQAPVLDEPRKPGEQRKSTLELEIDEGEGLKAWEEVRDFAGSRPDSKHYLLNRTTGEIRFGDNRRGHIPRAGQANVIARRYIYGGGKNGNVGARAIAEMVRRIDGVKEIFNLRPASGGMDEETIQETMVRVPRELQANDRAVTLQDFGELARKTPGAQVSRAYAFVDPNIEGYADGCTSAIQVVIVPHTMDLRPSPSETAIRMVCQYLDERRLVTTQVKVQGAQYHDVIVKMEVKIRADADKINVRSAIEGMLYRYLHPLEGGLDGAGWPFGRAIYYSELVHEVMAIPGVLRVDPIQLLKLAGKHPTDGEAIIQLEELYNQVQDLSCPSGFKVRRFVDPPRVPGMETQEWWGVLEVYNCCDLPVAEGALVALVAAEIMVDYERPQARSVGVL
jgi:hypothetical protein